MTTTEASTNDGRKFLNEWPERVEHYGYQQTSNNRCPRRLTGKRHRDEDCWCSSRLNDHSATYHRHGVQIVLWEPYDVHPEELARVVTAAASDSLSVGLSGASPYNPGSTVAITFQLAADQ